MTMTHMLFTLLQAGYYAEPASGAAHYSAATMGMFVLIIVIGIAGYAVQARLQSVFRKYSKVYAALAHSPLWETRYPIAR